MMCGPRRPQVRGVRMFRSRILVAVLVGGLVPVPAMAQVAAAQQAMEEGGSVCATDPSGGGETGVEVDVRHTRVVMHRRAARDL